MKKLIAPPTPPGRPKEGETSMCILLFNKEGEYIGEFNSVTSLHKYIGLDKVHYTNLSSYLSGRGNTLIKKYVPVRVHTEADKQEAIDFLSEIIREFFQERMNIHRYIKIQANIAGYDNNM